MSNQVYANHMEVSCKQAAGKSACAFPDVCFTPPQTPATPPGVPVPYPNTGMASDTSDGSTSVKISGQEVMLKNKSYFKKSTGDEAGCAPKKGVMTSKNMGKVYFTMWSMDVKVEGENVVRNLDMTTHNHASFPSNTSPWPYIDETALADPAHPCNKHFEEESAACAGREVRKADGTLNVAASKRALCESNDAAAACRRARKCRMAPFSPNLCCDSSSPHYSQPHHLVEDHWIKDNADFSWYKSLRSPANTKDAVDALKAANPAIRSDEDAPCVCATGDKWRGEHGELHVVQGNYEQSFMPGGARAGQSWDFSAAKSGGVMAHQMVFVDDAGRPMCDDECIKAQLDNFYGDDPDRRLNPPERIPPNTEAARGVTEQQLRPYLNPTPLTQKLPFPPGFGV
jgi:hypothetical protein